MVRLYKARPITVEAHFRDDLPDSVIVHLPNGHWVLMDKDDFHATYEPVIDLRV